MAGKGFQIVEETSDPIPFPEREDHAAPIAAITLALKALSQRALVAVSDLFTLLTVFSAFWLWHSIPEPSVYQLIGLGMYGMFVLAANVIVRRK